MMKSSFKILMGISSLVAISTLFMWGIFDISFNSVSVSSLTKDVTQRIEPEPS